MTFIRKTWTTIRWSLAVATLAFASVSAQAELKTVPYVDPAQYLGTWYQMARNPVFFENGCVCSRQVLGDLGNNQLSVYNSCNFKSEKGEVREIRGTATNIDPKSNSKFEVDFGLPKTGQYWIIGLDSKYRYAVVSEPSEKILYILSKTPELSQELYDEAVALAAEQIDTSKLERTQQSGCTYPTDKASHESVGPMSAPTDPSHPGSKVYPFQYEKQTFKCMGRDVTAVLPVVKESTAAVPAVIFGHGQALSFQHYEATFNHLAGKGVAAIFPMYDTGFFDQDWTRMGRDYVNITDCAVSHLAGRVSRDKLVFSGHSKGAYIASIAAGLAFKETMAASPAAVVLFETAGFDSQTIGSIAPEVATTVVFGDQDTVVERQFSESVYQQVKSEKKQFIFTKSYPSGAGKADHYWPQTKGAVFGGGSENDLHYYGMWKWLVAAGLDLNNKSDDRFNDEYLYGSQAADKGLSDLRDDIRRNW